MNNERDIAINTQPYAEDLGLMKADLESCHIRIAITVCNCADVVHAGGEPHRVTSIIELTEDQVPENLRRYFRDVATAKQHREKHGSEGYVYQSVMLSLVE